jgi:hypothetical protein
MIDTTVPQVVAEAADRANDKSETSVTLKVSKNGGFEFDVMKDGKATPTHVPNKGTAWDVDALHAAAFEIKNKHPEVFRLDLEPESDVNLNDLVMLMDKLRKTPDSRKIAFVDPGNGQKVETELMFPNISFANVIGH